jgi:hypothetical protein
MLARQAPESLILDSALFSSQFFHLIPFIAFQFSDEVL